MSCGRLFRLWQERLEGEEGRWSLRHIPDNATWTNRANRREDRPQAEEPWSATVKRFHHEDVRAIEDAHSRVIKTGRPEAIGFRLKNVSGTGFDEHMAGLTFDRCQQCKNGCGVVLVKVIPVPAGILAGLALAFLGEANLFLESGFYFLQFGFV